MDKDRKREIISEYKQRKNTGGVYLIKNTVTGSRFIKAEPDLASFRNRFQFSQKTGSCVLNELRAEWNQYGPDSFVLEFLEETEQKEGESRMGFRDRLKRMEEIWREKP